MKKLFYYGSIGTKFSLDYGGVDEYSRVPAASILYANITFTLNMWIKTTMITQATLFSKGALTATNGFGIQINRGNVSGRLNYLWVSGGSSTNYEVSGTSINDGFWHKITFVVTTDTAVAANNVASIYIDDALQSPTLNGALRVFVESAAFTTFAARSNGTGDFYTGKQFTPSLFFTGLTLSEIQEIVPNFDYTTHSQFGNLISVWEAQETYPTIADPISGFDQTMINMESADINTDHP